MGEWKSIKDAPPESTEENLIGYDILYDAVGEVEWESWAGRWTFPNTDDCEITDWMPMPDKPKK